MPKDIDLLPGEPYLRHTEQDPNLAAGHAFDTPSGRMRYLFSLKPLTMVHVNRFLAMMRGTVRERSGDKKPAELMRIREIDPRTKCGTGTTVMQLFRVDDLPEDAPRVHMVFHDRHGWYCQHGRECPAVAALLRHQHVHPSDP